MRLMVTGHRIEKLAPYDMEWIKVAMEECVMDARDYSGASLGLSGMASGVDLFFCQICLDFRLPYHAYVPFEEQDQYMDGEWAATRKHYLEQAKIVYQARNSKMVEDADLALVVWDGNKGGTHNCMQQLLEKDKLIWWVIPPKKTWVRIP